jgi:dihydrofolate reductase
MRPLTYYIGTSLDGHAAGPGDEIDFYPVSQDHLDHMVAIYPEVLPTHVRAAIGVDPGLPNRRWDTVVMGRRTYEPALAVGITNPYPHLRQYVVSSALDAAPEPAVTVVTDPVETVRRLKAEDGDLGVWLAGGGTLAGALADEIDELVVKVYPVVAGSGRPWFTGAFSPRDFRLVDVSEPFQSGCVVMTYERAR